MLSASAYSFRQKSRLAISLSWVAGYTNVVTFAAFGGIVVSHTTGNVTHVAFALGHENWAHVGYFALIVLAFLCGAATSGVTTELARRGGARSRYIVPVTCEALLLALLQLGVQRLTANGAVHSDWTADLAGHGVGAGWLVGLTTIASFAMGLQNATITRVSGAVVRTTHLTGVTTDLGLELVQLAFWYRDRTRAGGHDRAGRLLRVSRRHPTVQRVALLASIIASFAAGAVLGTVGYTWFPRAVLLLPVGFLLYLVLVDWLTPIADVRELDPSRDAELAAAGIVKALLPPALGIYRLGHHRSGRPHRAPNFLHWAERLPRRWRVVILAVSRLTQIDVEEAMALREAAARLRAAGRRLIVCGVNHAQFKALGRGGLMNVIDEQDVCPDLEFAIARGLHLLDATPPPAVPASAIPV